MKSNDNIAVLIVDDFPTMQKIIKDSLIFKGFRNFHVAQNGIEALSILSNNMIDIIICDINMPVMNGLELLKKIRNSNEYSNLPVIMITAETNREKINHVIEAGINEFIIKPFAPSILYKKIESVLSGHSPIRYISQAQNENSLLTEEKISPDSAKSIQKKEKPEILVVDDLSSNIDIIMGFLKDTYKVRVANSGTKAIKIVESDNPPDLILLDIMMPEMDGISVCKVIKDNPLIPNIPIIFLTAKTDRESLVEGFESGAVDYIMKPVSACELKVRVKNHLALKFSHDELKDQVDTLMENARLRDDVERLSRHDLKTPISSLINLTSTLQLQPQLKLLGEESYQNIQQIESTSILLMDMVNQSQNLYKIETGKYKFNPKKVNIKDVIIKVVKDTDLFAKSLQVQIQILFNSQVVFCLVEELLCYSIFSNLIKNAVEASEPGNKVSIDIKKIKQKGIISIHNAQSVPEQVRNSFFSKYVTYGKSQGTGIGTYSAQLLTEVQKGTINMETDESTGTTITLQFLSR
ncbi:MAG: response regulator [gamma proteobacterium symbiont of Taylorina sp.]|nr:response regulator [gamma proteobacterium symbiont of Taylorina sp.]